jgi:hypothetical protein
MATSNSHKYYIIDSMENTDNKKKGGLENDVDMIIEASEDLEVVKSFDEMGLREELLRGKILELKG